MLEGKWKVEVVATAVAAIAVIAVIAVIAGDLTTIGTWKTSSFNRKAIQQTLLASGTCRNRDFKRPTALNVPTTEL